MKKTAKGLGVFGGSLGLLVGISYLVWLAGNNLNLLTSGITLVICGLVGLAGGDMAVKRAELGGVLQLVAALLGLLVSFSVSPGLLVIWLLPGVVLFAGGVLALSAGMQERWPRQPLH
jgi:hypothetical protein